MSDKVEFTPENIEALFGNEAAEDEEQTRLRQYYFKSSIYNQIVTDLPVRILVGHKGIGKSALFKVAIAEEEEEDRLSLLIRPNDITDLNINSSDFLHTIRIWIEGLNKIIARKIFDFVGIKQENLVLELERYGINIVKFIEDTFQKLENKTLEYNYQQQRFVEQFLKNKKISVYIDDLDRGWQGRKEDISRLSALLNAVRDISSQNNRSINFKVALRSDVYYLVRTSDESTDKIEGSVIWHTWTNHEIFVLLIKRIETFFGRTVNENDLLKINQRQLADRYLNSVMESKFTGQGKWINAPMYRVMMSLIRKRPRDLVKLCTLAAKEAFVRKSSIIQTEDFKAIFEEYSQGRIQDTINEYRSELPQIERVLLNMKPNRRERTASQGYVYKSDELLKKIENIPDKGAYRFSNGNIADKQELAAFLYKINFLTARKVSPNEGIIRKYFEENRYLKSKFVDFGFDWEIHPAYRWALQPDTIEDIFKNLELSADEQQ
jgi:hypothetical protein